MSEPITINFTLPKGWSARHFWKAGGGGAAGFTAAIGPIFALGIELINLPETKGFALIIGPLWMAYARYRPLTGGAS